MQEEQSASLSCSVKKKKKVSLQPEAPDTPIICHLSFGFEE